MDQLQIRAPSIIQASTITTIFDPIAIPTLPPFNLQSQLESEDLIDLGQESLFSGKRNGSKEQNCKGESENVELNEGPVVSEELLKSLNVAKTAFLFALTGLLNQEFNLEHATTTESEASTSSSMITASTSSISLLLESLKARAQASTSNKETIQFNSTSSMSSTSTSSPSTLEPVEEFQVHLSSLMDEGIWSGQDAELAITLVNLLVCIERLLRICGGSDFSSTEMDRVESGDSQEVPGENVYSKVEREVLALREWNLNHSRESTLGSGVVSAAMEVELAEREVLWGRLDDLSERIGYLCAKRELEDPFAKEEERKAVEELNEKSSMDDSLPDYSSEAGHSFHPPSYDSDGITTKPPTLSEKSPARLTEVRSSQQSPYSPIQSEKMQQDLNLVTSAIERLYLVSPQLANQRVELKLPGTKVLIREKQLANLGNAIERLSKGRLEDQRAIPGVLVEREGTAEKAIRIRRGEEQALQRMLDQIDKSASRTLLDQRADMKNIERRSQKMSSTDPQEQDRREFILSNTGKGRLAAQDASFTSASTKLCSISPTTSSPVTISEFFKQEADGVLPSSTSLAITRTTSSSGPGEAMRRKFSGKGLFAKGEEAESNPPGRMRRISSSLGIGMFKSSSKTESIDALSTAMSYIAEESRNLGIVTVTFWPRNSPVKEGWEIISIQSNALIIAPSSTGTFTRIPLPCQVIPQTSTITSQGTFYECRLVTVDHSTTTQPRPDSVVHSPLSTAELRDALPVAYVCAVCSNILVDSESIEKYNALPSEHWAELLDAWMCHQDQALSDDLVAKGKGIKPRIGEGMVGSAYILFAKEITSNWFTPVESEPTRSEADDFLHPAHCSTCKNLVGSHVISLSSEPSPTYFRLLKYASIPISSVSITSTATTFATPTNVLRKYSLSTHITAEMLEIGQAHACHRFAVEDAETEKVRLLLWLFNPAIRISFASIESGSDLLLEVDATGEKSVNERIMSAVKVFYTIVVDEFDADCQEFLTSPHATTERISYPLAVVERLKGLLIASTLVYPVGKRKWGDFEAGFLERI